MPFSLQADIRIDSKADKVGFLLRRAMQKAVVRAAVDIENDARKDVPVLTGKLRDSITVDIVQEGNDTLINSYTTAGYGGYIELGTYKMRPRPFLGPAVRKHSEKLAENIAEILRAGGSD